jgi:phosphatidylglycerophosphatase A
MMIKWIRQLSVVIATGFGAGYSPIMPGTAGTLVAFPLFWLARLWLNPFAILLLTLGLLLIAIPICQTAGGHFGAHDAARIVIDEIVAMLLILCVTPEYWGWQLTGFVVFRFFDIVKPFPIDSIDQHLSNAVGVMLDDIVAAIYTIFVLLICQWLWQNMAS